MKKSSQTILPLIRGLFGLLLVVFLLTLFVAGLVLSQWTQSGTPGTASMQLSQPTAPAAPDPSLISAEGIWQAPDWSRVAEAPNAAQIEYGRELVAHTAEYLGPEGKVLRISNGMNCQNCHLEAGTAPLGNNFGAVAATYPKVRNRSGRSEDIPKRINDCFERSLNGRGLETDSKEMQAMVAYMEWLGQDVPKGQKLPGVGIYEVPLLDRAADPVKGKTVYDRQCVSCHGADGLGMKTPSGTAYLYPPLWGPASYNQGAGLFRLSRFAGYVKANMPLGATYKRPLLSDEEAWDLAAYVNSMERPAKDLSGDWPDISKKPMDHPFGPYSDPFSEEQHKYGPFQPILAAKNETK
ncbi:c-type cytochrome [Cyclobacterium xiamenense]|uniref:c-type cytochrome n=1 Tax=Cyclobacterium xiamenense TaxID=1297121 RepID=UPI0019D55909|nr:c-type cytochrome [Cyclobacterium xiamenense]